MERFWLVPFVVHTADQQYWKRYATEWRIPVTSLPDNVNEGDVVFIANQSDGIFAWGRIVEITDEAISVSRGAIGVTLANPDQIDSRSELKGLLRFEDGQFNFLTNGQVRAINVLLGATKPKPPGPRSRHFVQGSKLRQDEDLHTEYKNVKSSQIVSEVYVAGLSFLTQDGGSILFGISDAEHEVVGMQLHAGERDKVQRDTESKLSTINPPIMPVTHYTMAFHPVVDSQGRVLQDLYVFEVEIKPAQLHVHQSAGGKVYLKTFSGKKRVA